MEIKAVKFRKDGFYTQPFAFGGEKGPDKFDRNIRYRGSLQNYLIDTGSEVILVDTGLPAGLYGGLRGPRLQARAGDQDTAHPQTRRPQRRAEKFPQCQGLCQCRRDVRRRARRHSLRGPARRLEVPEMQAGEGEV